MSNYTKTTDFEAKDSLPSGDSGKIIKGTEFETEFDNIATAIATKADSAGPTFTGTLTYGTLNDGTTALTSTVAELNILDGVTSTTAELNILDGVTSTTAELNILDGVTATAAELNILDGVTSTTAELNILDGVTATTAELNILDGVTSTTAELNILDGITSFLDEDNMASNSATSLASQQSIKAYVLAQTGTGPGTEFTSPTVNAGLLLKNGATSAGFIEFFEDSDNGTNKVTLIGPASTADITLTLPSSDGDSGQFLTTDGNGVMSWGDIATDAITTAKILDDNVTSAKLAHALDIVTSVTVGGASNGVAISNGKIELKNSGTVSKLDFFCESSNAHYVRLQAPAHANFAGNVVITLPPNDGDSGQVLTTDGSGVTSWATASSISTSKAFFMGQI